MGSVESGYLAVDGGTVFFEVAGSGSPVVLSHDGMLHREAWDAQFAAFAAAHRVVRWDRRGYGRSAEASTGYSSVDDVVRVIRSVGDGPAALVGCSYGSLVSMHCALDHRQLVSALVLVSPIVSGLGFTEHFLSRGGLWSADQAGSDDEIAYWSTVDPWFIAPGSGSARERLRELLRGNPHNLRPKAGRQRRPEPPALPRLPDITAPTLIVVGEHDIPDVHAHAGAIEAGVAGAQRIVLARCGHLPHFEVPDRFNQRVLGFLSTLP